MGKGLKGQELGKGIRQRKDGRYEARAMINGTNICLYGNNLMKLKAELALEKEKAEKGIQSEFANYSLDAWFGYWFDTYKARSVKITSVAAMKGKYKNTFGRLIGKKKISSITNMDIQGVINQLYDEGKAVSSIRDALGRVRDCMESAKNNNIIASNPCFEIVLPRVKTSKEEQRCFSQEEQSKFLNVASDKWYKEMFFIMFLTGMRVGEVGGLMWSDIDFDKGCINVNRSLSCQYENGVKSMRLTEPKTYNSIRSIPFLGEAREMLLSQKEKQDKLKKELGSRWRSEFPELVFTTTMGSPCTRYIVEKEVNKVIDAMNYEESVQAKMDGREPIIYAKAHPHSIRHTFCTRCFERGLDPKYVQKIMGHSNYATTIDVYTHVMQDRAEDEIVKFGKAVC